MHTHTLMCMVYPPSLSQVIEFLKESENMLPLLQGTYK